MADKDNLDLHSEGARKDRERESEQLTYLPGHQALRDTEQCITRTEYITAFDESCPWIQMA